MKQNIYIFSTGFCTSPVRSYLVRCYKYEDYFEIKNGVLRFELRTAVRDTILMLRDLMPRMSGYKYRVFVGNGNLSLRRFSRKSQ